MVFLSQTKTAHPRVDGDAAQWFPKMEVSSDEAAQAFRDIEGWGRKHFGQHITMQRTATFFGMQLLENVLPIGQRYDVMPDGFITLMKGDSDRTAATFVHRMETVHEAVGTQYHYDRRIAFLAYAEHVAVYRKEDFHTDEVNTFTPYVPGWYLCRVQVPQGWAHVGLAPSLDVVGQSRRYPNRPGEAFDAWLYETEVRLLQHHKWGITIKKRMLFAPKGDGLKPLRVWCEKLCAGIEAAEAQPDYKTSRRWQLFRAGLRAAGLNTIGMLHRDGTSAGGMKIIEGQRVYVEAERVKGLQARWLHPEWSGAIYARARVATTALALKTPYQNVLAFNGDEVTTSAPIADVIDTGKVGAYRLKGGK